MAPGIFDYGEFGRRLSDPLWYEYIAPYLKALEELNKTNPGEYEVQKEELYDFVQENLVAGRIALGDPRVNWEDERLPVDMAVIHDTSNAISLSPARLSAIGLIKVHVRAYTDLKMSEADKLKMKGKGISSGHVHDGVQVFWTYHYLIRQDASYVPLLSPKEIGWHAGKWPVNCRSVALALDGDYIDDRPSKDMLETMAKLIGLRGILPDGVKGHCEVKENRECPSRLFLSKDGQRGWKEDLLDLL